MSRRSSKWRSPYVVAIVGLWFFCALAKAATGEAGLSLAIESVDGKTADARDARLARLVALCVPHDTAPSAFIPFGAFRANWTGEINLKLRDEFTFTAQGRGSLELLINGEKILSVSGEDLSQQTSKPAKLKKGPNAIVARYSSPADGDAVLRLYWTPKKSFLQPIPPTVFTHETDDRLRQSLLIRRGREVVASLRCLRCHSPAERAGEGMPELAADAPNLDQIGSRLNAAWIARWIENPRSMRPDASMPRLFHEPDAADRARDVAAYLATLKAPPERVFSLKQDDALAGQALFQSLGCNACHTPPDAAQSSPPRTALHYVRSKWKPAALVNYLREPEQHYAWTPMPNFKLSADESRQLAAYLLGRAADGAAPATHDSAADPKRGQKLFESSGCMNCHAPASRSQLQAMPLLDLRGRGAWDKGCLSDHPPPTAPDFALTDDQRAALRAFAATDWSSLHHDSPVDFAQRQIHQLRCTACHVRDAEADLWSALPASDLTLRGATTQPEVDQTRPTLTWTGEKLRPEWMATFIAGKLDYKPRPWVRARMPAFASRAALLAQGLSLEHGYPLDITPEPPVDPELAKIGMKLIGRNGGFSCNQCHAINQSPALVPFDSPAPNFMYTAERLRKDYYHRWTRSPQLFQPGTKMPTFADAEGKTSFKDILGGNAHAQFEAIWQYLRAGRNIVAPE